ncbi:MAG TPA: hypothetical protein VGE81_06520, partial [Candidatus Limnocylindrales bacterium]
MIAYSPLGQGLLSGSDSLGNAARADARGRNRLFRPRSLRLAEPLLTALRETAAAHAATPAQVALACSSGTATSSPYRAHARSLSSKRRSLRRNSNWVGQN